MAQYYTEAAGAVYVQMQEEEVARLELEMPEAASGAEKMQISADGAMIPLLHGVLAEVRTLVFGEVETDRREQDEQEVHTRQRRKSVHRTYHPPPLPTLLVSRALQGAFGEVSLKEPIKNRFGHNQRKTLGGTSSMAGPFTRALPLRKFKPHLKIITLRLGQQFGHF